MSIASPCAFIAAYLDHSTCELYMGDSGNIVAYVPTKATCETTIELGTQSYVTAEIVCRAMGIEPTWN